MLLKSAAAAAATCGVCSCAADRLSFTVYDTPAWCGGCLHLQGHNIYTQQLLTIYVCKYIISLLRIWMRNVHGKAYYLLCCVCVCVWGSSCFCAFILLMPHRMQIYMKRAQCEFMFFFCWCSLLHSTTCIMLEHNTYIYKTHIFCHVCGVCFFLGGWWWERWLLFRRG